MGDKETPGFCICSGYEKCINREDYPKLWNILAHLKNGRFNHLRVEIVTWGLSESYSAVTVRKRKADLPPEKGGPCCLAEIRFFECGDYRFIVNGNEVSSAKYVSNTSENLGDETHDKEEIESGVNFDVVDDGLSKLGFNSGYCAGIPVDEYNSACGLLAFLPRYLVREEQPVPTYRAKNGIRWVELRGRVKKETRKSFGDGEGRCTNCSRAFQKARQTGRETALVSPSSRQKRSLPTSTYAVTRLSPESLRNRYRALRRVERVGYHKLRRLKTKLSKLYSVELSDDQSAELKEFVDSVKEDDGRYCLFLYGHTGSSN